VAHIQAAARSAETYYPLRLLAEDIVGGLGSKDYVSEILAVYYWVLSHTRYANDPRNVELVRRPRDILRRIQGATMQLRSGWRPSLDCDDLVALTIALFLVLGREVRIVTVAFAHKFFHGERQYSHVYLQVREPKTGTWIVLDPVAAESSGDMLRRVVAVKIWPVA
jgi:hypothetical protein